MVIGSDMSHDLWGPWREEIAADHEEERYYLNTDTQDTAKQRAQSNARHRFVISRYRVTEGSVQRDKGTGS